MCVYARELASTCDDFRRHRRRRGSLLYKFNINILTVRFFFCCCSPLYHSSSNTTVCAFFLSSRCHSGSENFSVVRRQRYHQTEALLIPCLPAGSAHTILMLQRLFSFSSSFFFVLKIFYTKYSRFVCARYVHMYEYKWWCSCSAQLGTPVQAL